VGGSFALHGKGKRAGRRGCVRVGRAVKLALTILNWVKLFQGRGVCVVTVYGESITLKRPKEHKAKSRWKAPKGL